MNPRDIPGNATPGLPDDVAHRHLDYSKVPYRKPQPAGMIPDLVVPDDCAEMITFFIVHGALLYVDPDGRATGYDDVFTRREMAAVHHERSGMGRGFVEVMTR